MQSEFEMISFFFFDFAQLDHYFDLALMKLMRVSSRSDARGMRIVGFRRVWFRSLVMQLGLRRPQLKTVPDASEYFRAESSTVE
jgi:hypothetical protein